MKRASFKVAAMAVAAVINGTVSAGNEFDYCLLCHGANANGNYGIRAPKLSGMESWYLARQLENFAAGIRGTAAEDESGHEMYPVGLRVKQEQVLEAAVAFVATLESKKPASTVSGDVAHGKRLYQACAACHGAKAEGNATLQAPALASRSDWYLVTQLRNFRSGLRGADPRDTLGAQMRSVSGILPDDEAINDVVAYINTL